MWKVLRYTEKGIITEDGDIICPAGKWYLIGTYNSLEACTEIVKHDIYLYDCTCTDEDPNPRYRIESNFDDEEIEEYEN